MKVWAKGWDNAHFHAVMPGSPAPAADFVKHADEWAAQREWNHPCTAATAAGGTLPHTCPDAGSKSCSTKVACQANCDAGFGACSDGKGVYYCRSACTGTYQCQTNRGLLDYACNPPPPVNGTRIRTRTGPQGPVAAPDPKWDAFVADLERNLTALERPATMLPSMAGLGPAMLPGAVGSAAPVVCGPAAIAFSGVDGSIRVLNDLTTGREWAGTGTDTGTGTSGAPGGSLATFAYAILPAQ